MIRRLGYWILICLVGAGLVAGGSVLFVAGSTARYRYADIAATPPERVALVFGAGVRPDGRPSPMLADRLQAAIALYQQGRVSKLLMSGDNSTPEYDEVTTMKQYAVDRGVPEQDITLDYAGFSTYESCYRARVIFGVEQAVLVTQQFHLPRAVYTCRSLGINSVGLGTADWGRYRDSLLASYTFRETLATLNALVQVHITRPAPTFLGAYEGIA